MGSSPSLRRRTTLSLGVCPTSCPSRVWSGFQAVRAYYPRAAIVVPASGKQHEAAGMTLNSTSALSIFGVTLIGATPENGDAFS